MDTPSKSPVVASKVIPKAVSLATNERSPSDWSITEESGKIRVIHTNTAKNLLLDSVDEFNKLLRS